MATGKLFFVFKIGKSSEHIWSSIKIQKQNKKLRLLIPGKAKQTTTISNPYIALRIKKVTKILC